MHNSTNFKLERSNRVENSRRRIRTKGDRVGAHICGRLFVLKEIVSRNERFIAHGNEVRPDCWGTCSRNSLQNFPRKGRSSTNLSADKIIWTSHKSIPLDTLSGSLRQECASHRRIGSLGPSGRTDPWRIGYNGYHGPRQNFSEHNTQSLSPLNEFNIVNKNALVIN